jgi:hypothetical protein
MNSIFSLPLPNISVKEPEIKRIYLYHSIKLNTAEIGKSDKCVIRIKYIHTTYYRNKTITVV